MNINTMNIVNIMKSLNLNKKIILSISAFVLATGLTFSFAAGEYYGFDSYQAYLNNYYAQQAASTAQLPTIPTIPGSQVSQTPAITQPVPVFTPYVAVSPAVQQTVVATPAITQPVPVFTPTVTPAPTSTFTQASTYYNGFSNYQDYLNNYYATVGRTSSIAPSNLQPLQTQTCLSVTDILQTDVEGHYLACDGTLYIVTRNSDATVTTGTTNTSKFSLNYNIQYERLPEVGTSSVETSSVESSSIEPEGAIYTPVYVYPELEPRTITTNPVPAIEFTKSQALEFTVGNSYTFNNELELTALEINDNRCFAGQYCAQAGNVVAKFAIEFRNEFRNERNLLTVTMNPGEEPEVNFLLANTSIKFTGLKYDQSTGQPVLQSIVQSR